MTDLSREDCVACRPGAAPVAAAEAAELKSGVPEWTVAERDRVPRLERTFAFPDFARAMDFAAKVGAEADRQDHHPALLVEWGRVTVSWWTHRIRGLHRNDFVMAAKTDALFRDLPRG